MIVNLLKLRSNCGGTVDTLLFKSDACMVIVPGVTNAAIGNILEGKSVSNGSGLIPSTNGEEKDTIERSAIYH